MTGPIAGSDDRVYSFGPFIADPAEGTLYRDGALVALALADGDDFALVRLLGRGVGDDDAAGGLALFFDALDDDSVMQWTDLHTGLQY